MSGIARPPVQHGQLCADRQHNSLTNVTTSSASRRGYPRPDHGAERIGAAWKGKSEHNDRASWPNELAACRRSRSFGTAALCHYFDPFEPIFQKQSESGFRQRQPARPQLAATATPVPVGKSRCGDDSAASLGYPRHVLAVRRLLAQRFLAMLVCAATLLLKLMVPTGYMIGDDHGGPTIELCSGVAGQPMTTTMSMPGMHGDMPGHGKAQDHGKAEMPCAFSGLSAASLGAVDPIQIAALIAFVLAVALLPAMLPAIVRRGYLRPPLRGPPLPL